MFGPQIDFVFLKLLFGAFIAFASKKKQPEEVHVSFHFVLPNARHQRVI